MTLPLLFLTQIHIAFLKKLMKNLTMLLTTVGKIHFLLTPRKLMVLFSITVVLSISKTNSLLKIL